MKKLLLLLFVSSIGYGQFFKNLYKDFLQYGTIYVAGNVGNAKLEQPDYFIRTNPENLYDIPRVIDETTYHPYDYRYGVGIRKLARFGYENKPNFYNGTENNIGLSSPTSAFKGLEYLLHFEKERINGDEYNNKRFFVRHTGKYHIAKFETRESGKVGFEYTSGELRARLPIGKKLSVSLGAIYRTHQKPYGYNPIEIWLNETFINPETNIEEPLNPWYSLGYFYGFTDEPTTYTNEYTGESFFDWIWRNEQGDIVAYGDRDFRDRVFGNLMNRFNNEVWSELDAFAEVAPVVGFDFYHYKSKFWLHAFGSWILPHHKYVKGEETFSYLNRNNWGKGGLVQDSKPEQWEDIQFGLNFGWKVGKNIGIFAEGEYNKMWDTEFFNSTFGINFTFR